MILTKLREEEKIVTEAPKVGKPYVFTGYPNKFYEYDPELSNCVEGYKKGPENPYVEKLMKLSNFSKEEQ